MGKNTTQMTLSKWFYHSINFMHNKLVLYLVGLYLTTFTVLSIRISTFAMQELHLNLSGIDSACKAAASTRRIDQNRLMF